MDLRRQEEQISQWINTEEDGKCEDESEQSASEIEDNLVEEIHRDTDSQSDFLIKSSESDEDNIRPNMRQRTQIIDSDDSQGNVMPVRDSSKRPLVGVVDDGIKTVRFVIYEAGRSDELVAYEMIKTEIQLQEGWSEQDPLEIMHHIKMCAEKACDQLVELGYTKDDIVALGITNQRETTIAWDKYSGEPLHAAIAWNDIRTDSTVDGILAKIPDRNKNYFKSICGLPISPYFSALKMRWMKDNVKAVRRASRDKRLLFGTVDSWIVWNMTGGPDGGLHITEVTNASRTLLMNLETLNWDPILMTLFGINRDSLPTIHSSSEVYGTVKDGSIVDGIRISGILGNQQSALVGQNCLQAGQVKNTYRSGCFLLYNTGNQRVNSTHDLITTVAYKLGPNTPAVYALEGSVAIAGGAMKFLLEIVIDTEHIAGQVFSTGYMYFVRAFSGLYAPYWWRKDARGIICGLFAFTTKNHIIKAALEAVFFQTRDMLEAMHKDCGIPLAKLHVDGKMTCNDLLMQLQADLTGIPVLRSQAWDMSALGAAVIAGGAVGVWSTDKWHTHARLNDTFIPITTDDDQKDPQIIFDCDDNPIMVQRVTTEPVFLSIGLSISAASLSKKIHFGKVPTMFKSIYRKISSPLK